MKKILLAPLLFVSIVLIAQEPTKQQDIQKLLTSLHVKASVEKMATQGIELYKKQKPAVPQKVWNDILNAVDYSAYLNKVAEVFDNNYTQPEIKHLIDLANNAKPGMIPKLKPTVKEQLYYTSNEFGKNFGNYINTQLKAKMY